MLLPNMSMKEIRKEIEEELPILRRRTEYVATGLKYSRNVKSNVALAGTFNYCSEFQNTWYVRLELYKSSYRYSFMAAHPTRKGLCAISPLNNTGWLLYFTKHCFYRYDERLKLGLPDTEARIKAFMNQEQDFSICPERWGHFDLYCVVSNGLILGRADKTNRIFSMNTYITKDMIRSGQIKFRKKSEYVFQ
jgi:hypothetical protein